VKLLAPLLETTGVPSRNTLFRPLSKSLNFAFRQQVKNTGKLNGLQCVLTYSQRKLKQLNNAATPFPATTTCASNA
jgi:hypothetical protein